MADLFTVSPAKLPSVPIGTLTAGRGAGTLQSAAQKARSTGEDFEAVFLSSVFKEMFSGLEGSGPLGGGAGGGTWRSFLTDEYARSFARAGGVGLGEQVYRSLLAQQEVTR